MKAEQLAEQEEISHLHETAEAMKRSRDQCRALREAISSSGKELESKREELLRTKVSFYCLRGCLQPLL